MNPTTQQPTYELLKDILTYKAGEKFILDAELGCYIAEKKDSFGKRATWHTVYVEGLPDWFRRVEVKDWEVVAYSSLKFSSVLGSIRQKGVDGKFYCLGNNFGVAEEHLNNEVWEIHSVRRLSDGVTFTVREEVIRNNFADCIDAFEINGSEMNAKFVAGELAALFNLSELSKLPSPPVEQETIKVIHLLRCAVGEEAVYEIKFNKVLGDGDGEKIKKAIEDALNDSEPNWVFPRERLIGIYDSVCEKTIELYKKISIAQSEEIRMLKKAYWELKDKKQD